MLLQLPGLLTVALPPLAVKKAKGRVPGDAMTDTWGSLDIEVVDGEIVVTAPFTSYTVTYYKLAKSPQLLAKRIASRAAPP
jgi:hypothetical protein